MRISKALFGVAENFRDAMSLGAAFPLRHLSDVFGKEAFSVHIRGVGRMRLRRRSSDASAIRQIFRDRQYELGGYPQHPRIARAIETTLAAGKKPVIIDGGANIGAASLYFATTYPQAHVVAIEPDPANAAACERNVESRPNVTVLRAALGATGGSVDLVGDAGEAWAVQTTRSAGGRVPVITIDDAVASVPNGSAVIVKIDIEGFEDDLFSSNLGWLDGAAAVLIEPHDWMMPERKSSRAFQRAMAERDFDLLIRGENLVYIR